MRGRAVLGILTYYLYAPVPALRPPPPAATLATTSDAMYNTDEGATICRMFKRDGLGYKELFDQMIKGDPVYPKKLFTIAIPPALSRMGHRGSADYASVSRQTIGEVYG